MKCFSPRDVRDALPLGSQDLDRCGHRLGFMGGGLGIEGCANERFFIAILAGNWRANGPADSPAR